MTRVAAAALLCALLVSGRAAARPDRLDPVGIWHCLLYRRASLGNERMYVRIDAQGTAAIARIGEARAGRWSRRSPWRRTRGHLEFADRSTGRRFDADLAQTSLGGVWTSASLTGGWWCSRVAGARAARSPDAGPPPSAKALVPELEPLIMATPRYPIEAIREAKQGRAVSCFTVKSSGEIVDPELVELSDEIFRKPTLEALSRSSYRGWADDDVVRPGCRTFLFRLDSVY